jgi:acetyl-CoA synthetase
VLIEHEAVAEAAVVPSPYKRVRRLEFAELPKTISGKIRRVELRTAEQERLPAGAPPPDLAPGEFWEEVLPELRH